MSFNIRYLTSVLLFISFGLLSILVPGGPIETRSFSHIDPLILGGFNPFLTSLAMISVFLIYFILKDLKWAYLVSAVCGVSYFLVYALDLGVIFPISPDAMPPALYVTEILGAIASIPLVYCSIQGALNLGSEQLEQEHRQAVVYSKQLVFTVLIVTIAGIGIIAFATKSAMGI